MDEMKAVLDDLDARFSTARVQSGKRIWLKRAARAAVILLACAAGVLMYRSRQAPAPVSRPVLTRLTSWPGLTAYPDISPDGKLIVYASDRAGEGNLDIWVQQVGSNSANLRLTNGSDDAYEPAFSRDGSRIAYRSEKEGGGLYIVSSLGGESRFVAGEGRRPRFSPNGNLIAYWSGFMGPNFHPGSSGTYVVPLNGGAAKQIATQFAATRHPVWMPDGRHLLILGRLDTPESLDWWIAPIDGGRPIRTGAFAQFASQHLQAPPLEYGITPGMFVPQGRIGFYSPGRQGIQRTSGKFLWTRNRERWRASPNS